MERQDDTEPFDFDAPTVRKTIPPPEDVAVFENWGRPACFAREMTDRCANKRTVFTVQEYQGAAGRFCIQMTLINEDGSKEVLGTVSKSQLDQYMRNRYRVGDGVHYSHPNDVYPATVRKISKSGHQVWVSNDRVAKAEWDESFGPRAKLYEPRDVPESEWSCFTRRQDGEYRAKGRTSPVLGPGRHYNRPREI